MELNKISLRSVFALGGKSRKMLCRKMCNITSTNVLDLGREGASGVGGRGWVLAGGTEGSLEGRGEEGGRQGRCQLSGAAGCLCPLSVRMERFSESSH